MSLSGFQKKIKGAEKTLIVDFWAPWCGPCKLIGPIIEKIAHENEQYNIGKLNADDNRELVVSLGVKNIPTCIIFKDGKIVERFVGLKHESEILEILSLKEL